MNKPVLLVMAAGMGSRYGGLKQIDPIGGHGEIIIDYSLYDAKLAGFEKAIFIIKKENEDIFKELILPRAGKHMEIEFVYQNINDIPHGCHLPEGREKPWGTGHAVLAARNVINTPFAVINADDFYGREAFEKMYEFLKKAKDEEKCSYAMVGFYLKNTITENGSVSRGVCVVKEGYLQKVTERTRIEPHDNGIAFTEDDGKTWIMIDENATASMNFFGFTPSIFNHLSRKFTEFFETTLRKNPEKAEFYLPYGVDETRAAGLATVRVLSSSDKWYGVTYKEDKKSVVAAIKEMTTSGKYPEDMWR